MGKITSFIRNCVGLSSTAPNFPPTPPASQSPAAHIRPSAPTASTSNALPSFKPLPPTPPEQAVARTNAQGTALLNPTPATAAPNPYYAPPADPIISITPLYPNDPKLCDDVEAAFENFVLDYSLEDLQKFNTTILDFNVKNSEYPRDWMCRVVKNFSNFLIDPSSVNKSHKPNRDIPVDQVLSAFANLLLMYNFAATSQSKVNDDLEIKGYVLNVIHHFKAVMEKTTRYNQGEKYLANIEIAFLEILLTDSKSLFPERNFYNKTLWDVNSKINPSSLSLAAGYHGLLLLRHNQKKNTATIDCVIAIRNLAVVILNDSAAGKPVYFAYKDKIRDIYTNIIYNAAVSTPVRMKAINLITEIALHANNHNMKNSILALLDDIVRNSFDVNAKSHIRTCMHSIENSRDEYVKTTNRLNNIQMKRYY